MNKTIFATTAFRPVRFAPASNGGAGVAPAQADVDQGVKPADQAERLRVLVREIVEGKPMTGGQGAAASVPSIPVAAPDGPRAATIAIASGKGGVGKTTLAVNLAIALAQRDVKVCLIDADLGLGNADVLCGLNPRLNLAHRVSSGTPLDDILLNAPGGFTLLPGASGMTDLADLDEQRRSLILQDLRVLESRFEVILIDCGAGIGSGVLSFLRASDTALIVTTPEPTAITDAYALIKCLRLCSAAGGASAMRGIEQSITLAVNLADDHAAGAAVHQRIEGVCSRFLAFSPAYAGAIRRDVAASRAVCDRSPLLISQDESRAGEDVRALSGFISSLCGLSTPARPVREGLVARLLRVVKAK